ncbi:MAG: MmcQ/YjbR family DNA-binding protein [Clostridiales bacterium]|nr:MmcQ/YjbR family DNA-binding protein [Clostridiales bacterium]
MDRKEIEEYIMHAYGVAADFPWAKYPNAAVFRHDNNKKWFALVMEVAKEKLGVQGEGSVNILNVKCNPIMIGSLRRETGFYPAYHMSKASWITAALDGSADAEKLKLLIDMSYGLTSVKVKRSDKKGQD